MPSSAVNVVEQPIQKKASKSNIEESPEPIGKPDLIEPVTVNGGTAGRSEGEAKGIAI